MTGIDLFLKYAYAPNLRGFCGPRNFEIIEEGMLSGNADKITEINKALNSFTGALPYLRLIAGANHIQDPFDTRVVEAYWIGNELLNNVSVDNLRNHLRDRFKSKTSKNVLDAISNQALVGAKPHHSFHVLDAFTKSGGFFRLGIANLPKAVLSHIDECRIGWGTVQKYIDDTKLRINIEYSPIIFGHDVETQNFASLPAAKLQLGLKKQKILQNEIEGRKLFLDLKPGDLITFHWSRICDRISTNQMERLKAWTEWHLKLTDLK